MKGVYWLVNGRKQIKVRNDAAYLCFYKWIPKINNSIYNKLLTLTTWPNAVDVKQLYSPTQSKSYHWNTKVPATVQEDSEEPETTSTFLSKFYLFILIQSCSVITGIANKCAYLNIFFIYKFTQLRNEEKIC